MRMQTYQNVAYIGYKRKVNSSNDFGPCPSIHYALETGDLYIIGQPQTANRHALVDKKFLFQKNNNP
eukprot:m.14199 g.14199  ORF g.14199 m.14199 type:complete len:67 (+) comp10039_c0_seq1:176-376(+)